VSAAATNLYNYQEGNLDAYASWSVLSLQEYIDKTCKVNFTRANQPAIG
jgi:hypothetical protein